MEKTTWYKDRKNDDQDEDDRKIGKRGCKGGKVGDKSKKRGKSKIKAVMFVPYTHGRRLAKKLREAEISLEELTGYRLKIVERGGRKLEDLLHRSNPWEGKDCERQNCLPCQTKLVTGKYSNQSCSKRSAVYETWCKNCEDKNGVDSEIIEMKCMTDRIVEMNGGDRQPDGIKREKILFKYVGETARSVFERGHEHLSDVLNLSQKSHILRHYVESHSGEDLDTIRFNMKVIRFTKTAFERQILESVLIQENRHHNLLNSKSEYNRCSIPRITLKMGDSEMKITDKKAEAEMKKEEMLMAKVRDLRKERSRKRGNRRGNPTRKKIRLDEEELETNDVVKVIPNCLKISTDNEDRKRQADQIDRNMQRRKRQKRIGEYFGGCKKNKNYGMVEVILDCSVQETKVDSDACIAIENFGPIIHTVGRDAFDILNVRKDVENDSMIEVIPDDSVQEIRVYRNENDVSKVIEISSPNNHTVGRDDVDVLSGRETNEAYSMVEVIPDDSVQEANIDSNDENDCKVIEIPSLQIHTVGRDDVSVLSRGEKGGNYSMDEVIPDISVQEYRADNNDMNGSSEVASNCKDDEMVQECDDKMTTVTQKCDDNMVEVSQNCDDEKMLRATPDCSDDGGGNLGTASKKTTRYEETIKHLTRIVQVMPDCDVGDVMPNPSVNKMMVRSIPDCDITSQTVGVDKQDLMRGKVGTLPGFDDVGMDDSEVMSDWDMFEGELGMSVSEVTPNCQSDTVQDCEVLERAGVGDSEVKPDCCGSLQNYGMCVRGKVMQDCLQDCEKSTIVENMKTRPPTVMPENVDRVVVV